MYVHAHLARMKLAFVVVVVASIVTENLALPVQTDEKKEDVVKRCLIEVLSKALSKTDTRPLDQECKYILQAGVKNAPLETKDEERELGGGGEDEEVKGQGEVSDIEAFLRSADEARETLEGERGREPWDPEEEGEGEPREKRSNWRAGRHYQRKHKRGDVNEGEEEEGDGGQRSQESWDMDGEEKEKRTWRPGRYQQRRHKRENDVSEEPEQEERSQESWDFNDGMEKRDWRAGRHHQRRHKRDEELSDEEREEPEEERSQESFGLEGDRAKRDWRSGRHHQRRHKRDEELSDEEREEPEEERSQESFSLEGDRAKRDWRSGRHHQRRHKREEELSNDPEEEERSQESWDFNDGREKRDWRSGRHHQRRHKRDEEPEEEERSQESWDFDKRNENEDNLKEKRIWKPTHRYHHKLKLHKRGGDSSEQEEQWNDTEEYDPEEPRESDRDEVVRYLAEKRNPWIYRGYYHPAWFKRDAVASQKMQQLAELLSNKMSQLTDHSKDRNIQTQPLTPQEEQELEKLAAVDMELQKITAKLHEKRE